MCDYSAAFPRNVPQSVRLTVWRYPLGVGGGIRPRNGIPRQPEKSSKNAAPIPSRVHALLGAHTERKLRRLEQATTSQVMT